jgi:hypothetical protein
MLRVFVLVLGVVLMLIGLWPRMQGEHVLWAPLIWGFVLFAATLLERWRYRADTPREGTGWEATEERFIDPESGRLMQVFYQPATGERRYEPAADQAG